MDRQRRKQDEFLVHEHLPWVLIEEIGVFDEQTRARVEQELGKHDSASTRVNIRREWDYGN